MTVEGVPTSRPISTTLAPPASGSRVADLLSLSRPLVVATFTDSSGLVKACQDDLHLPVASQPSPAASQPSPAASQPSPAASQPSPAGEQQADAIDRLRQAGMDIAEIRVDRMGDRDPERILTEARRFAAVPTIATIRCAEEGGLWQGTEAERLYAFGSVRSAVDAIDIELAAAGIVEDVSELARSAGRTLIVSSHHFTHTPAPSQLEYMLSAAQDAGAGLFKLAAWANEEADLRRLAKFTLEHAESNVVVMAMGPFGPLSRVFFPALGSRLTYVSVDAGTAVPGQLTLSETVGHLERFYPTQEPPSC